MVTNPASAREPDPSVSVPHGHIAQFYHREPPLLDFVGDYLAKGMQCGETCIVVATRSHRDGLEARLAAAGFDVRDAAERRQYIALDADEALSRIMFEGAPERGRFFEIIGGLIQSADRSRGALRVFGEMVALLCNEGNMDAAIRLEELWNELIHRHPLSLFCAYPMDKFGHGGHASHFARICRQHSTVLPASTLAHEATAPQMA